MRHTVVDENLKQHLALAREHYGKHEYTAAEHHLREVLRYTRDYADVHNMLGVIHHDRGELHEARQAFECAMQINRGYTEAALNLAVTYNDLGLYAEARRIYAEIAATSRGGQRIDPFARGKLANLHARVAQAYEDLELHHEAADEYRRALALCPEFADLRTRLGTVLRAAGDSVGAVREFEEAIRCNAGYVQAYVSLGITHFTLGRGAEARHAWEGALAQDPTNKPAQMYLRMLEGNTLHPSSAPAPEPAAPEITGDFQLSIPPDRSLDE